MGTVGSEDQSCLDKMTSLVIPCLVMVVAATQAHTLTKRSAVHAVPVVSTPAIATAGYAVGASGAVGGQTPASTTALAPVVAYAGALPVAHHSAVAIANHAIPAEHHSVPIVPLTHATVGTAYPHAFSYGLKSAPCVNVNNVPVPCATGGLLSYGWSSLSPSLWSSPNLKTLVSTTYSSPDVSPPDNEVAGVVDLRTAGSDRKKRDAGYLGYHGGYLGGYLGHHGGHVLGLKSAPCVNVNNVPVPCATGGLYHHGHLGYLG